MSEAIWDAFIEKLPTTQQAGYTAFKTYLEGLPTPGLGENADFFNFVKLPADKVADLFEMFSDDEPTGGALVLWSAYAQEILESMDAMDGCTPPDQISSNFLSSFDLSDVNGIGEILLEKFFSDPPVGPDGPIDTFAKLLDAVKTGDVELIDEIKDTLTENMLTSKCSSSFQQSHAKKFSSLASGYLTSHTDTKSVKGKIEINSTSPLFKDLSNINVVWYSFDPTTEPPPDPPPIELGNAITNSEGEFELTFNVLNIPDYTPESFEDAGITLTDTKGNLLKKEILDPPDPPIYKGFFDIPFPAEDASFDETLIPDADSTIIYPSYAIALVGPYAEICALLIDPEGVIPDAADIVNLVDALEDFVAEFGEVTNLNDIRENGGLVNFLLAEGGEFADDRYVLQFDAHVFLEPIGQNYKFNRWLIKNDIASIAALSLKNRSEVVALRNTFNAAVSSGDKISDFEAAALHQKSKAIAYYLDNLTIDWRINNG